MASSGEHLESSPPLEAQVERQGKANFASGWRDKKTK